MTTNAATIHREAHLLAGPIARGERELTDEEREHLAAAQGYISMMIDVPPGYSDAFLNAIAAWNNWRAMRKDTG